MDTRFLSHRDSSSVSQQSKREIGKSEFRSRKRCDRSEVPSPKECAPRGSEVIFNSEFLTPNSEFKKVCAAVREGHSVLVLGETGLGTGELAQALYEEMLGDFQTAISKRSASRCATYKGSLKKFFTAIAFQLGLYGKKGQKITLRV